MGMSRQQLQRLAVASMATGALGGGIVALTDNQRVLHLGRFDSDSAQAVAAARRLVPVPPRVPGLLPLRRARRFTGSDGSRTPYMGVNTYYGEGGQIDERSVTALADAMVR